jgi:ABC-type multidrug transport system ATPase subunit
MGQFSGLLYKNLKIQSKNKCGVICQLLTPMICLLIIFGLQKLVDSLKFNDNPKANSFFSVLNQQNQFSSNALFRGLQPNMGSDILKNIQLFMKEMKEAEVNIKSKRKLNKQEMESLGYNHDMIDDYEVIESEKIMDDLKIPFNLIVPINLPLSNQKLREIFQHRYMIKSCYKMLKYGLSSDDESTKTYLTKTLKIDDNDNNIRRTDCKVHKDHKVLPAIKVPNVSLDENLTSEKYINDHMIDVEFEKLKGYDIFKIYKEKEPTDGFMLFDKANDQTIKGLITGNNIQFFAYHHMNFMNMVRTEENLTIYLNTETYITMLDILSNSILMKDTQPKSGSKNSFKNEELASFLQSFLSNLTYSDFVKFASYEEEIIEEKEPEETWYQKAAGLFRQIISLSLTLPERDYNKLMLQNMFQLLNIIFYPFAIGLGLPIILTSLAMEKEEKIHDLLKINGMSMIKFYLSNFVFWFIFLTIIVTIFFVGGYFMLDDGFFYNNSPVDIVFFCLGWNVSQIIFAFFLLTMLSSAGAASAVGYIICSIGTLFSVNVVTFIYPFPATMPLIFNIFPQCNYVRLMYYFLVKGSSEVKPTELHEFHWCMAFLYINIVIYGSLIYIISKKRFWKKFVNMFKKKNVEEENPGEIKESRSKSKTELEKILKSYNSNLSDSDNDELLQSKVLKENLEEFPDANPELFKIMHFSALREKRKIFELLDSEEESSRNQSELDSYAVITKSLLKVYDNNFQALRYLNLKIKKGNVYGLLGPNGAGKTTLISIITGFLNKTEGKVFVNGLDMDENQIPNTLALCPQFNIQWPNLTVTEHLTIFGMMRNIPRKRLSQNVKQIIEDVGLTDKRHVSASKLSGGMRRRLSIAIALTGDTDIIFLDEPTTGLDPKRRRELWAIIKKIRYNKTFIISTHLMEEAEFLCDRIGIINKGNLRATGSANFLKNELVDYFQAEVTIKEKMGGWTEEKKKQIQTELKGRIIYEFGNLIKIKIKKKTMKSYLEIFEGIERCQEFIKSWSLKNGSLEDAFTVIEKRYVD